MGSQASSRAHSHVRPSSVVRRTYESEAVERIAMTCMPQQGLHSHEASQFWRSGGSPPQIALHGPEPQWAVTFSHSTSGSQSIVHEPLPQWSSAPAQAVTPPKQSNSQPYSEGQSIIALLQAMKPSQYTWHTFPAGQVMCANEQM